MTIKHTGASLSMSEIAAEFGGSTPYSLSAYYAGGALVPAGTVGYPNGSGSAAVAIPSSSTISINNFYGASNIIEIETALDGGNITMDDYEIGSTGPTSTARLYFDATSDGTNTYLKVRGLGDEGGTYQLTVGGTNAVPSYSGTGDTIYQLSNASNFYVKYASSITLNNGTGNTSIDTSGGLTTSYQQTSGTNRTVYFQADANAPSGGNQYKDAHYTVTFYFSSDGGSDDFSVSYSAQLYAESDTP